MIEISIVLGILLGLAGAFLAILFSALLQLAIDELRAWRTRRRGVQP